MTAVDLEQGRRNWRARFRGLAVDAHARWLRSAAQAFVNEGYTIERLEYLAQDEETGHVFAEILAEVRSLQGCAS